MGQTDFPMALRYEVPPETPYEQFAPVAIRALRSNSPSGSEKLCRFTSQAAPRC